MEGDAEVKVIKNLLKCHMLSGWQDEGSSRSPGDLSHHLRISHSTEFSNHGDQDQLQIYQLLVWSSAEHLCSTEDMGIIWSPTEIIAFLIYRKDTWSKLLLQF